MATDPYEPLVADRAPLNTVKYAARDYASIFDDLLRRLKAVYTTVYNDYATTTQGIMLIEMMAYATAQLQWYLDRTASDCFLETARTPSAANRIVRQLGYKMRPAAAASVELSLTFPDGTTGPFTMPARWRYQGPAGLVYESYAALVEPLALAPGTQRTVSVRQGDTFLLTFTANGAANQTYPLSSVPEDRYLADLSVEAWVDGLEWEERTFLTYANDEQFEVDYTAQPPLVRFGDGIAGAIPPTGAEVKLRFVVIDGIKGNEPKAHSISSSIDVLSIGGAEVTFEVDHEVAPTGGTDPEETDHARRLAPLSFAARGAAITALDYDALSNSFVDPLYGSVAKAYAFNPRGTYADLTFNNLVEDVEAYLVAYVAAVAALEADLATGATTMSTYVATIQAQMAALENLRALGADSLVGWVTSAKVNVQAARAQGTTAETAIAVVNDTSANQKTALEVLYAYVSDDANFAPSAARTHVLDELTSAIGQATGITGQGATALAAVQAAGGMLDLTVSTLLNPTLDALTNDAPVAPDTSIPAIKVAVDAAATSLQTLVITLGAEAADIDGKAEDLQANIVVKTDAMRVRIAQMFSDDCLSNYVQVPILSLDADGNYVAPSVGLIMGLQAYLDGIKEVTQQVQVVNGAAALVPAQIEVELLVGPAYVYEEEAAKARAAIVELLKGRDFNEPLYLSDLHRVVEEAAVGMVYTNIAITGPSDIDPEGNLVPAANRIITLGSLAISNLAA
ncbi:MAG: hypothetical protein WC683_01580 [bacterium]